MAKLTKQLAGLDILLKKLRDAVNTNNSEDNTEIPVRIDNNTRIFSYIQIKACTTEKTIITKLRIVWDAEKEPGANTILHRVIAHLHLLEDIGNIIDKDVDIFSNQIITADLTEPQAKELSDRITILVNTANTDVETL